MGNKRAKVKKGSKSKQDNKDRKKIEKIYGDGIRNSRGQKNVINKKRHKGSHTKGTRKGNN